MITAERMIIIDQRCTSFFGHGPLIDFLISSGGGQTSVTIHVIAYVKCLSKFMKMMFTVKYIVT